MISFFKGLGLGLLCLVIFIFGLVFNEVIFGSQNELTIQKSVQSEVKLTPSIFSSNVEFSAGASLSLKESLSSDEKAALSQNYKAVLARAAQDEICEGGGFTLEPTFFYKDGVQTPKGQRFSATLSCKITQADLEKYNKMLNDIDKIIANGGFLMMNIPALNASFSPEDIKKSDKELGDLLVKEALAGVGELSTLTGKACALQHLNLESSSYPIMPRAFLMNAKSSAASNDFESALPLTQEGQRSATAVVSYVCR